MKKYLIIILFCLSTILSGCYSINEGNEHTYASYTFMFQWEAEIFARHRRNKGYEAIVYKNNWFNNGGYPWAVGLKKKSEVK